MSQNKTRTTIAQEELKHVKNIYILKQEKRDYFIRAFISCLFKALQGKNKPDFLGAEVS